MSFSREERLANYELALQMIGIQVHSQSYRLVLTQPRSDEYSVVHNTTWLELERDGLIATVLGGHAIQLTGLGWRRAMEALGRNQDPAFQSEIGKLCKFFKDLVRGRNQQQIVSIDNVAAGTGVPLGTVANIVDGQLIDEWLGRQGPRWAIERQLIAVPIDFGLEKL